MSSTHNFTARAGVREVFDRVRPAYMAGGAVRDLALGREAADADFATPLLPERVSAALGGAPIGRFGDVRFKEFTITTFRRDIYRGSRYPKV
ncbi:MAG: hypothetical protein LBT92_01415, partial [Rickettsiales bacterium]|nr:hypothetical protein [Rickettsiales bacterium]